MTIATDCDIIYDRETNDYAGYLYDSLVGFYPNHLAAETAINALRHELIQGGLVGDATLHMDTAPVADATAGASDEDTDTLTCPCPHLDESWPSDVCPCRSALERGARHVVMMDGHGRITTITSDGNGNGGRIITALDTGDGWQCSSCATTDIARRHHANLMYCVGCYAILLGAIELDEAA